jgi:hypothetical protein
MLRCAAGNAPENAMLGFHREPLKGVPEEMRTLRITLTKSTPIDLTTAFRVQNEFADLGGRDLIYFLIRRVQVRQLP